MIAENAIGQTVAEFRVFGINSLKTLVDPAAFVGKRLKGIAIENQNLLLSFETITLEVDLQRTGGTTWFSKASAISSPVGPRLPTGRLLFADGGALDFSEPAKTKRIAFWIKQIDN
ncbi:hypothetical protein ACEZCY_27950 [Streptacidiphilus sp. N1-12]|uniref:Uncharacterized protein n=2 Tax=Streptacidiphilus alkalitolerans TaxID=3342712 RepID=A0ABV6VGG1_9ACTN